MTIGSLTGHGRLLSARRALISLAVGALAGLVVGLTVDPKLAPLAGWCTACSLALIWVWRISWPLDHTGTKRVAQEEQNSRATDNAIILATLASLGAVVLAIVQSSGDSSRTTSVTLVVLGALAEILSWALVNTVYAFKYARLYFLDEHGGIDFKQDQPPAYSDFAYLAFTVGMTFAVSDTEPASTRIRRSALPHALLAYLFGTVIIAVAINLVTNLGQS